MAHPTSILVCSQTGQALPCRSTFSSALVPVFVDVLTQRLLPSAAQSMVETLGHSFNLIVRSEWSVNRRRRMSGFTDKSSLLALAMARVEPSGERLQLYAWG